MLSGKIVYALLAALGGLSKQLHLYLHSGEFRVRRVLANVLASGFSGYIGAEAALVIRPEWAYVAAGVVGYLGAEGWDFLLTFLQRRADRAFEVPTIK